MSRLIDNIPLQNEVLTNIGKVAGIVPVNPRKPMVALMASDGIKAVEGLLTQPWSIGDKLSMDLFFGAPAYPTVLELKNVNDRLRKLAECGIIASTVYISTSPSNPKCHKVSFYVIPDWTQFDEKEYLFSCRGLIV